MTGEPAHGPDPVDGLRLAMMQRREAQLLARLKPGKFGVMEGLQLLMLACGILFLVYSPGRSRLLNLVLGWTMIIQAVSLWWLARRMARQELLQLRSKMAAVVQGRDGQAIVAAAASAQSLLLDK